MDVTPPQMRKVLRKVSLLSLLLLITACERDDICAEGTPTTPRVLIGFYDIANQDEFKPVSRLTAYGEDLVLDENGQPTQPVTNSAATLVFNTNTTELALPLLVGTEGEEVVTRFVLEQSTNLRLDDNVNTSSNEDILELRYKPQFVYVSRACGYKSVFTELEVVPISDSDNWIINVAINENINGTVENENTIHVQIFH